MRQAVIRITSSKKDAEILVKQNGKEIWKNISIKDLSKKIRSFEPDDGGKGGKPVLLDKRILAMSSGKILYREPEHRRLVFYGGRSYEINFPAAINEVSYHGERIKDLRCWTYLKWQGLSTVLYQMPMPNMMSCERMCIGTADRTIIRGNVLEAVDRITDTESSHGHVDNLKKPTSTVKWFTHLKKNHVSVEDLKRPDCKLCDLIETGGAA